MIVPCGIADHGVTSLAQELAQSGPGAQPVPSLETVAHQAARQFGMVFGEQVLAVESLEAPRAGSAEGPSQFPAEDTPLRVPTEVNRLQGHPPRPVQA
jgi:lipoyl(octanoyl) transferase